MGHKNSPLILDNKNDNDDIVLIIIYHLNIFKNKYCNRPNI